MTPLMKPCPALIAGLAALTLIGPLLGQTTGPNPTPPSKKTIPAGPVIEPDSWEEDSDRMRRLYASCMSPEAYRRATVATGMWEAIRRPSAAASSWISTGPTGNFVGREYNGRVAGIEIQPDGGSGYHLYVGASSGGLWKSTGSNLGSWVRLGDSLPNPSVRAFAVDPADSSRIFVGTGDYDRIKGSGLFVTTSGGAVWDPVTLSVNPEAFYRLSFVPGSAHTLLAASDQGILRSTTGGTTWDVVQVGHCTDLVIDPATPQRMYATVRGQGLFRSIDGGGSWTLSTDPDLAPAADWGRASLAICRDTPATVALVVEKAHVTRGVYRTTDSGGDWTNITGSLEGFGGQMSHAQAIAIHPSDPDQIFVGSVEIAVTPNAGSNWIVDSAPGHADITQLYFSPETGDDILWVCNDGGIYRRLLVFPFITSSENGSTNGLAISQFWYGDADRLTRVGGLQDNGIIQSADGGQSWAFRHGGDGFSVEIVEPEQSHIWLSDGLYDPPPSIRTFRYLGSSVEETTHPGASNPPLFYQPRSDLMFSASARDLVSRSQSGSVSPPWTLEVSGLATAPNVIWEVFGSLVDGETLFVNFYSTTVQKGIGDLALCRRNGPGWDVIRRDGIVDGEILSVLPSPLWKNEFWITVASANPNTPRILHTVDDGATWTEVDSNLRSLNRVWGLEVSPFNPLELYAATDIGIFRTLNGGLSWEPFQDGLPVAICKDLRFVADDQHLGNHQLVLFTFGRGTWQRALPGPAILYVDLGAIGVEDGTFEHPFDTVTEAVAAAPAGAVVMIRSATYTEPVVTSKSVTLVTYGGTTVIR